MTPHATADSSTRGSLPAPTPGQSGGEQTPTQPSPGHPRSSFDMKGDRLSSSFGNDSTYILSPSGFRATDANDETSLLSPQKAKRNSLPTRERDGREQKGRRYSSDGGVSTGVVSPPAMTRKKNAWPTEDEGAAKESPASAHSGRSRSASASGTRSSEHELSPKNAPLRSRSTSSKDGSPAVVAAAAGLEAAEPWTGLAAGDADMKNAVSLVEVRNAAVESTQRAVTPTQRKRSVKGDLSIKKPSGRTPSRSRTVPLRKLIPEGELPENWLESDGIVRPCLCAGP